MRFLYNNFYFGRHLPAVVIALDAPTFGIYERQLLRKIFPPDLPRNDKSRYLHFHSNDPNNRKTTYPRDPHESIARPVLICADAAYKKVSQYCGIPEHHIDFVVGDLDTLKPEPDEISSIVDTVADFDIPTTTRQIDTLLSSQDRPPYVLKVRDQDTTDFEKCLQLCTGLFRNEARHRCESNETPFNSNIVLTIGAQGGEWHHEASILHTAAKYSRHLHLRVHSASSTIMFCAPFGKTVFRRNREFESDVFAVVPLGLAPRKIKTTGLKWNLEVDTAKNQGTFFGWTNRRKVDIRNYMMLDENESLSSLRGRKNGNGNGNHNNSKDNSASASASSTSTSSDRQKQNSNNNNDYNNNSDKDKSSFDPYDELSHTRILRKPTNHLFYSNIHSQANRYRNMKDSSIDDVDTKIAIGTNDLLKKEQKPSAKEQLQQQQLLMNERPTSHNIGAVMHNPDKVFVRSYMSTSNAFAPTESETEDNIVEIDLFDPPKADGDLYVVALTVNNRKRYVQDLIESTVSQETAPKMITRTISEGQNIEDRFQTRRIKLLGQKAAVEIPRVIVSAIVFMTSDSDENNKNKKKYLVIMDNGAVWSLPYQRLQFGEKSIQQAKKLVEEVFFPPRQTPLPANGDLDALQKICQVDNLLDFEDDPVRTWALLPKKERDFHLVVIEHAAVVRPNWQSISINDGAKNDTNSSNTRLNADDDKNGIPDVFQKTFDGKRAGFFTKEELEQMESEGKTDKYVTRSIDCFEKRFEIHSRSKL